MRCIVSNTGPLLHLYEAEALDLLGLTGSFYIPPTINTIRLKSGTHPTTTI